MFNRIGIKVNGALSKGLRLGKKVAGYVKRIGTKALPVARGLIGMASALGGSNKAVAKFVNVGKTAVGMGDRAVALSNRVLSQKGVGSGVSTIGDKYGRAYKKLVQGGDATQAIGLLRDNARTASNVRTQVVAQAKSALQKVRKK